MERIWIAAAGLLGFAGGVLGAAGRHVAPDPGAAELIGVASQFLWVHALALIGAILLARGRVPRRLPVAAGLFLGGAVLFGGGVTLLALIGHNASTPLIPVGGSVALLGWLALAAGW